jgi:hypothetical protein
MRPRVRNHDTARGGDLFATSPANLQVLCVEGCGASISGGGATVFRPIPYQTGWAALRTALPHHNSGLISQLSVRVIICRFSNSDSYRGLLTCVSHVCLTSFHLGLSHFAFHFLAVPVSGFDVPGCFLGDLDA